MKKSAKRIQLDRTKLFGFRKAKCESGKNSLKPLTITMVGGAKIGNVKGGAAK